MIDFEVTTDECDDEVIRREFAEFLFDTEHHELSDLDTDDVNRTFLCDPEDDDKLSDALDGCPFDMDTLLSDDQIH